MPHGKQFLKPHLGHRRAQGFQPLDGFATTLAAHGVFGDQAGNGPSVPGDDDGFAPLDVIEELGQMDFRFGCLYLAYGIRPVVSTSPYSSLLRAIVQAGRFPRHIRLIGAASARNGNRSAKLVELKGTLFGFR
jgi:hypothetical protein